MKRCAFEWAVAATNRTNRPARAPLLVVCREAICRGSRESWCDMRSAQRTVNLKRMHKDVCRHTSKRRGAV